MNLKTITKPNQILKHTIYNSILEINSSTPLTPILNATFLIKNNNNYYYLSNKSKTSVYYEVEINPNSKLETIILLIKINNLQLISTLDKAILITLALKHFTHKECCELLAHLKLAPQEQLIRQCIKITNFPTQFLTKFKNNYSISIKQLFYYERFEYDFLKWYSDYIIEPFKLSFSQFNSFLDQLYSLKKRSIKEFNLCVNEINKLDKTNKHSQLKLKNTIYKFAYPTLYKENKAIEKKIEQLNLPEKIAITWDKSLENKQLNISISCNKNKDMKLLDVLKDNESEINDILKNFGYENS